MKYEIWLSSEYGYFKHGVAHLDDGRTLPLSTWIHSATYGRDSVLIDDEEHFCLSRFPLRWLVGENSLEFYSIDADTPTVLFHNESGNDICIVKFGVLQDGKSIEVQLYGEQEI